MRLRREDSLLLVVDVQEKLAPHVMDGDRIAARCEALARAAAMLGIPAFASEHCPDRIGGTLPGLRGHFAAEAILRKTHFSCADEPGLVDRLASAGRSQVLVAGMEAHVCLMQTALGLAGRGFDVFVARDAVGSRRAEDRAAALERLAGAGCAAATTEMALFEWMHRAGAPEFRALLQVIKALPAPAADRDPA